MIDGKMNSRKFENRLLQVQNIVIDYGREKSLGGKIKGLRNSRTF